MNRLFIYLTSIDFAVFDVVIGIRIENSPDSVMHSLSDSGLSIALNEIVPMDVEGFKRRKKSKKHLFFYSRAHISRTCCFPFSFDLVFCIDSIVIFMATLKCP